VEAGALSPDGTILVTASQDGTIRLRDVTSRELWGRPWWRACGIFVGHAEGLRRRGDLIHHVS